MKAVSTIHVLIALAAFAIVYALWVMYYFVREDRRMKQGGDPAAAPKKRKGDIVGQSRFVLPERHSQPQAATETEIEKREEKENIFATSEVPEERPRQIPPEELDEVFGDVPEGETNEPLDIDYPLDTIEDADEPEDEEMEDDEESLPPVGGPSLAQGVSFEEMGEAYRRVVHNQTITDDQKEETGRILLNLQGTDMYKAFLSGQPGGEDRVTSLIDTYLSAFHRRMSVESANSDLPPHGEVPSGFDVRQFM